MSLEARLRAAFERAGLSVSIEPWRPGGLLLLMRREDVERVRAVLSEMGLGD